MACQGLERLAALPVGWDGYQAPTPNATAIANCERWLSAAELAGCAPSRTAPSVTGGIGCTHGPSKRFAYVECTNTGGVYVLWSDTPNGPAAQQFDPSDLGLQKAALAVRKYLSTDCGRIA